VFRVVLLALFALIFGGCASGPERRVFPPEARVQEVRLKDDGAHLQLRIQSFSTVPSEVQAYALTLEFAGSTATRLEGSAATTVLPQAAEVLAIDTRLEPEALERARAALAQGTALRYRLHGTVTVKPTGRAYPIDYSSALSRAPGLDGVLR